MTRTILNLEVIWILARFPEVDSLLRWLDVCRIDYRNLQVIKDIAEVTRARSKPRRLFGGVGNLLLS